MAHITVRHRQTKSGLKWTATQAQWVAGQNKIEEVALTPTVLADFGFSLNMTPVEAKAHAKKLNSLNKIKRKEQKAKVRASERLHDLVIVENSIVPVEMSRLFVDHIKTEWNGGAYNLRKQIQHWSKCQKIVSAMNIQPHEYFKRKNELYKHFQALKMGRSYVEKLLKVLNLWGEFYAEQTKTYFKKVPGPEGVALQNIKANAKRANGEGAEPMTLPVLNKLKNKLPAGQWEYLRACLWLGLRPSELDEIMLHRDKNLKSRLQDGTKIIEVYQGKLIAVDENKRWKSIPLIHPEQLAALKDINSGTLAKPLVKTIRNYAPSDAGNLGLYSGRKGFTDLMLELGQSLEDISQWMGHASIERTWKHYKNKRKVSFKKLAL